MPWHVDKSGRCPADHPWAVIKDSDGSLEGCHETKEMAERQMAALYASEEKSMDKAERAEWTTAFINSLPDSSFLYIAPGGEKDEEGKTTPRSLRYFPYKDAAGKVDLPHLRNALARIPQSNLSAAIKQRLTTKAQGILQQQQGRSFDYSDDRFRADFSPDMQVREDAGGGPVLSGHFIRWGEWAEINSTFEGHFMERFAAGAFKKTIEENRAKIRVLFEHGKDALGKQVLGPIRTLEEDSVGVRYEVPLFEGIPSLILAGLRAGQYGSSFRFRDIIEEYDPSPESGEHNPDGIPERTVVEARLREFGPVTFPAYAGSTAGIRSLTDEFKLPALRELIAITGQQLEAAALEQEPTTRATEPVTRRESRSTSTEKRFKNREEFLRWIQGT